MMAATIIFTLSGPWNKSVTKKADSFAVCFINLFVGGLALFVLGTVLGGSSMCKTHWRWWSCCIWLSSAGQAMCCGPC